MKTRTVYVIGDGFSAGVGYPLTSTLLFNVWGRLGAPERDRLKKIIQFHHPHFDVREKDSFPNIETLLTEIDININLFLYSRPNEGNFKKKELLDAKNNLLRVIAAWFHELYKPAAKKAWLKKFIARLKDENAVVISFNWDLLLDHLLFDDEVDYPQRYGLSKRLSDMKSAPVLLKPHGSLNWYQRGHAHCIKSDKRSEIFFNEDVGECVDAFVLPRPVRSKVGNEYEPLIVPPTFFKDFDRQIFKRIWKSCTRYLSVAEKVYFLGYSLPESDQQARFILRCGLHNQIEGLPRKKGDRYLPTGPAEIFIVNPDDAAAKRIGDIVSPEFACEWYEGTVEAWCMKW